MERCALARAGRVTLTSAKCATNAAGLNLLAPRSLIQRWTKTACLCRGAQHPRNAPKTMAPTHEVLGDVTGISSAGQRLTPPGKKSWVNTLDLM
jgi:hypothetical protein